MQDITENKKEYVYVVLSQTGTILSLILKYLTKAKYNHASISLDNRLDEMYSFGRKYPYNIFYGAYVKEHPSYGTLKRFYKTTCQILKLEVTIKQKESIENIVKTMYENKKQYKFDALGIFVASFKKKLKRKNYFYCSEFVRTVLVNAGVISQEDLPKIIKPIDFLSLKNTETIYVGNLKEYVEAFNK
jgi:hypothetical protein